MDNFVHLHLHTVYSLQDGKLTPKEAAKAAKANGMSAVAITDHGVMHGAVEFYNACKAEGIKPIIGMEAYKAGRSIYDKTSDDRKLYHLVLLAKNNTGYHNLVKLASIAATEGKYYKPRVDFDLLEKYHEGLIALSACVQGEIPRTIIDGDYDKAKELALKYKSIFGEDFYLEVQWHAGKEPDGTFMGIPEEEVAARGIFQLSKELDIPVVATNDVHYLRKEDAEAQHVLMAISCNKTVDDPTCMGYGTPSQMYFKTKEQMWALFGKNHPDALENTVKIAEKCNVEIEQGNYKLPQFPTPEGYASNEEYFRVLCDEGLTKRYGTDRGKYEAQLAYEVETIKNMGFIDYFLIVSDFIRYAKRNNIYVGPGRGSAAGSIVSYVLEITELDPVRYGLVFERFLNPERITMPDIDVDFEVPEGRQAVVAYVAEKYGADHVSQIGTFGQLAAKSAIRAVARALGMELKFALKVANLIPKAPGITIQQALESNKTFAKFYNENKDAKRLVDLAKSVEGTLDHPSVHAAGLIIAPSAVTDYIPVMNAKDSQMVVSQYSMGSVEATGMLKVDFLGLRNLTILKAAVEAAKDNYGVDIDLGALPFDDKGVYEMLSRGDSNGVFQLESDGMKKVLMELKPTCIEDIIAVVALYRPGPMDNIPTFIANKKDPSQVVYKHPALEPILRDTYGICVYQEQVMSICREIAGYSLGRADLVRRVMSKKKHEAMAAEKDIFINGDVDKATGEVKVPGALRMGVSLEVANALWDEMSAFASYAFNRAHAACYGVLAYQTAWMKVHYPLEYQAAMLTNASDNSDKLAKLFADCNARGIKILPPSVNKSGVDFEVEDGNIRFGLTALKGVGRAVAEELIIERRFGLYEGMESVATRCPLASNKSVIEALVKSGALDGFGQNRAQMLDASKNLLKAASAARKKDVSEQISFEDSSFFKKAEDTVPQKRGVTLGKPTVYAEIPELSKRELLDGELKSTGIYLSGHPMTEYEDLIKGRITHRIVELNPTEDADEDDIDSGFVDTPASTVTEGEQVRVAGIITTSRIIMTRKNEPMAFATLEDQTGSVEMTLFPRTYEAVAGKVTNGIAVLVFGKAEMQENGMKVIVNSMEFLDHAPDAEPSAE